MKQNKWRSKNHEKIKSHEKQGYEDDREKIRDQQKKYYDENREVIFKKHNEHKKKFLPQIKNIV